MKVLVVESKDFSGMAVESMRQKGLTVDLGEHTRATLGEVIGEYDGLIIRLGVEIDADLLQKAERLQLIATLTTGLNHIDMEAAKSHGITVISLKDEREFLDTVTPVAEHTWGLILDLYRRISASFELVKAGQWDRNAFVGREVSGRTLGIVGLGRLGLMTARIGRAFGCVVIYFDPKVESGEFRRIDSLSELASRSDIVSLHVPLDDTTTGMIDAAFFTSCRKDAILINTSRGEVVDEAALLTALTTGSVAGAGLDVLSGEVGKKSIDGPLTEYARAHENLIITPHIGGAAFDTMRRVEEFMTSALLERLTVRSS